MATLNYDFLPWARRGLARAHQQAQLDLSGTSALPVVQIGMKLVGKGAGADETASPELPLKVTGPGDIIGIDPRIIVRTEPRSNNHNFEPNYLAAIEFDPPDFPWMFTPATADANNRLMPWLALVVFDASKVGQPQVRPGRLLPSVILPAETPLPALAEAWMWAHAQVVRDNPAQDTVDMLKSAPTRNLSRLVCPQRLAPNTSYFACLVPVFKPGRDSGLGRPLAADALLQPSWEGTSASADLELPAYFHWHFGTGPAGDFETLARRLQTPKDYADNPDIAGKLARLGRLPTEVDADHVLQPHDARALGKPYLNSHYLGQYEGALLSLHISDNDPPDPGEVAAIAQDLATILNAGEAMAQGVVAPQGQPQHVPVVGPPIYGAWHAATHKVVPTQRDHWLNGLNCSVPRRMGAGVGTRVVQKNQEIFMQAAWRQAGDIIKAERLFSLAHLSRKSLARLVGRLQILPESRRLAMLAPAASRIRLTKDRTVYGYAQATSLPQGFHDGAMRRSMSPARALLRKNGGAVGVRQLEHLADAFSTPASVAAFAQPARFRFDGLSSLKALDGLQLPATPDARVVVPGFADGLKVTDAKILLASGRELQARLKSSGWRNATLGERLKAGVLLDSHYHRLDVLGEQLAAGGASAVPSRSELATALMSTKASRPEGVQINVQPDAAGGFALAAQGLKVDARGGQLLPQIAGGFRGTGKAMAGAVGAVNATAIRRYGNAALFNSLPANTLPVGGVQETPVHIVAGAGGNFSAATGIGAVAAGQGSITVAPPVTSKGVLARFGKAWQDKIARDKTPAPPAGFSLTVVPFDHVKTAAQAVIAIDPAVLVTRRVESLLQLGSNDFVAKGGPAGFVGPVLKNLERFIIPRTYDRVMACPKLDEPLYKRLVDMDKSAFMPGVEDIPNDTILLVKTNPKFIESFLVGSNHEMGRELLWRGFPTDCRGTPFQKFWAYFDRQRVDIDPIHQWNSSARLGLAGGQGGVSRLALLIRGQLLLRYPNTNVYAVKKDGGKPPDFAAGPFVHPDGGGVIGNDIVFFLFPLAEGEAHEYWWVLEEPMTEPRFGFDDEELQREVSRERKRGGLQLSVGKAAPVGAAFRSRVNAERALLGLIALDAPPDGDTWLDVDWAEVGTPVGRAITLAQLAQVDLTDNAQQVSSASSHAGEIARALLQRPFRGYFDGSRLS
ncbi:MAG: hypothetical protein KA945_03615 [Zoogloea sp.]|nr:hypothetical protein [Zoogloea sp.]